MGVRYEFMRSEVDERQPFTAPQRSDTKLWMDMDMLTCKKQAHAWNQEEKKKQKEGEGGGI
jgi:uncharacterized Zn ribbon protein